MEGCKGESEPYLIVRFLTPQPRGMRVMVVDHNELNKEPQGLLFEVNYCLMLELSASLARYMPTQYFDATEYVIIHFVALFRLCGGGL